MGEDVRFARNSQKNIRELIGRHEMAQTEYGLFLERIMEEFKILKNLAQWYTKCDFWPIK